MWALAKALGASQQVAGLVALGFALSGGLWLLSVEAEFVTIPLALQLSALWLILGIPALHMRRPLYALLLGLVVALAIFSYLTSFALLLVALVGLGTAEMPLRMRWRQISLFGFTVLLLVGPALALILDLWSGSDWNNLAALGGQGLYGQLHWFNVAHGLYAFLRSFGLYPGLAMNDSTRKLLAGAASWQRVVFFTYYLLLALLAAFPLLYLLRRRHAMWQAERRVICVLAAWIIPFAIFAFIWVPGDLSFWAPVLAGWWLVVALCFTYGTAERWLPTAVIAVLILGLLNATMVILPRRNLRSNLPYQTAQQIAAKTDAADLILTGPQEMTALSLIYFANRQAWPVELVEPIGSDLPPAIAAQAQAVRRAGGQLYYLDAHGALRPID
jgi:hypothetical protein